MPRREFYKEYVIDIIKVSNNSWKTKVTRKTGRTYREGKKIGWPGWRARSCGQSCIMALRATSTRTRPRAEKFWKESIALRASINGWKTLLGLT